MIKKNIKRLILGDEIIEPGVEVICLPGFNDRWDKTKYPNAQSDPSYGGAGYREGRVFRAINKVDLTMSDSVVWPDTVGSGVYSRALRKI